MSYFSHMIIQNTNLFPGSGQFLLQFAYQFFLIKKLLLVVLENQRFCYFSLRVLPSILLKLSSASSICSTSAKATCSSCFLNSLKWVMSFLFLLMIICSLGTQTVRAVESLWNQKASERWWIFASYWTGD